MFWLLGAKNWGGGGGYRSPRWHSLMSPTQLCLSCHITLKLTEECCIRRRQKQLQGRITVWRQVSFPTNQNVQKKRKRMCGATIFWINIPNLISSFSIVLANQSCNNFFFIQTRQTIVEWNKNGHVDIFEWVCFKKLSSILEIFEARLAPHECAMVKNCFWAWTGCLVTALWLQFKKSMDLIQVCF